MLTIFRRTLLSLLIVASTACGTYEGMVGQRSQSATSVAGSTAAGAPTPPGPASSPGGIGSAKPSAQTQRPDSIPQPVGPAAFLLDEAHQHQAAGDYQAAATSIERAMRIEPGNPWLSLALARVRLSQNSGTQAEALAQRALTRAGMDQELNRQCWMIIADARLLTGDSAGASQARTQASQW